MSKVGSTFSPFFSKSTAKKLVDTFPIKMSNDKISGKF